MSFIWRWKVAGAFMIPFIGGATVVTLGTPGATIPSVYTVTGDINITGTAQLQIIGPVVLLLNGNFYLNPNSGDAGQILDDTQFGVQGRPPDAG